MALGGCTGVFIGLRIALGRESGGRAEENTEDRRLRPPRPHAARQRHPGERIIRAGLRPRPERCLRSHRANGSKRIAWNARPFTSSRRIPRPRCSSRWKRKAVCCTAIGRSMTRPRRVSAEAHDAGGTRAGLCLDLPAPVFAHFDLAAAAGRLAGGARSIWRCRISTSAPTASGTC